MEILGVWAQKRIKKVVECIKKDEIIMAIRKWRSVAENRQEWCRIVENLKCHRVI